MLNSNSNTADKLIKLSNIPNECSWDKNNKKYCSNDKLINKMDLFLKKYNYNPVSNSKEDIVDTIKKKLNCNTEACVLANKKFKSFAGNNLISYNLKENFKPEGPIEKREWLSNVNIDETLKQFEKLFKNQNFLHIPFQMRDFQSTNSELTKINFIQQYQNGMRTAGVVFNTDRSTGRGIHWYSVFFDFRSKPFTIEYFNSSGEPPQKEIHSFLLKTKHIIEKGLDIETEFINVATFSHQTDNSSCGPYALYYIYLRLSDIPYSYFRKYKIPDELMYLFRQHLFRQYI